MRSMRPFLVFLFFVVIAGGLLSFFVPTYQQVERSITLRAPAETVYEQISRLENFKEWSAWSSEDSLAIYTLGGTDGTPGATMSWKGDAAVSGDGSIKITELEKNRKVSHEFLFESPRKMKGLSDFTISGQGGTTNVTWKFRLLTPRPWNIFNLFSSMDKELGKDFERGLESLRLRTEQQNGNTAP
ncbi:MAG: SRPBCC family protein [Chitinophagaceae bacterium]